MITFNELQRYLKRPALYERTIEQFWTNPYIADQMLKAHLDPAIDAASRNPEFIIRCANWISSMLFESASLLDIGCGPGLYTKQFAERGLRVTGIDFSEKSIAYARKYDSGSQYFLQDYLTMDFDNEFDMLTLIYYDYGALIPDERHNLLRRVYKSMKPGGLFLFDIFTPLKFKEKHNNTSWSIHPEGGFWSEKSHICLNAENDYDEIAEGRRHVIIDEDGIRCYNLWDCYFTTQSIAEEVAPFGFSVVDFYKDATGATYTDDSETLCVILKKE